MNRSFEETAMDWYFARFGGILLCISVFEGKQLFDGGIENVRDIKRQLE